MLLLWYLTGNHQTHQHQPNNGHQYAAYNPPSVNTFISLWSTATDRDHDQYQRPGRHPKQNKWRAANTQHTGSLTLAQPH